MEFILIIIIFLFLFALLKVNLSFQITAEGIQTCAEDDAKINECFKQTFQEQMKLFKTGSEALNIPQLDPWVIPVHRLDYSNGGIQINFVMNNGKVNGMAKTIIKNVRSKINKNGIRLEVDMFLPEIFMEGNFKANVKYNELKMKPKGYYNLTMNEISNTATLYGTYEQVNGIRYLRMKNFNVDPQIRRVKFNINGLFPDPTLDNVFTTFINQYWLDVYKFILAETKPTWEPILIDTINQFLSHVPIDTLIVPPKKMQKI